LPSAQLDAVDHLLILDPGRRGIGSFFQPGGARRAAAALRASARVLITTGFMVEPKMPETDGPPGAAVLGRALRQLGADVSYVTDPIALPVLAAALRAIGEPERIRAFGEGPRAAADVLDAERPTHLVAIERPARSRSGDYLNMRGQSVAEWNRPIDEMFVRGRPGRGAGRRRAVTVGVGDGGNEIGMGNVRRRLLRQGPLAARIASVVRVDHLVVAGASNWGAYGIVAALGALTRRPLLHPPALERRMLEACVKAGAVDGITRRAEATVDGLPAETQEAIVELLGRAVSWAP
jgi:hypothetical protein